MKYAIVIPDGCADEPQASLGGKTPLEAARTPHMDAIAAAGVVGRANHVPASLPAGSDVANLSLLGYDPMAHFTGRAPLEAARQIDALTAGGLLNPARPTPFDAHYASSSIDDVRDDGRLSDHDSQR